MSSNASPNVSKRFCFQDADITFQSIDGVLFKAHKRALVDFAPGFLKNFDSSVDAEGTIHLPESSSLLELLFQYIYPLFRPSLDEVELDVVEALGNAGERYRVHNAILLCWIVMR